MLKIMVMLSICYNLLLAKDFEAKYLACTIVNEFKYGSDSLITERIAKTRNLFKVHVTIKETSLLMKSEYFGMPYKSTNRNGYDIYGHDFPNRSTIAYYKQGMRLLLEKRINNEKTTQCFECIKRSPSIKERAKLFKEKWL